MRATRAACRRQRKRLRVQQAREIQAREEDKHAQESMDLASAGQKSGATGRVRATLLTRPPDYRKGRSVVQPGSDERVPCHGIRRALARRLNAIARAFGRFQASHAAEFVQRLLDLAERVGLGDLGAAAQVGQEVAEEFLSSQPASHAARCWA